MFSCSIQSEKKKSSMSSHLHTHTVKTSSATDPHSLRVFHGPCTRYLNNSSWRKSLRQLNRGFQEGQPSALHIN